MSRPASESPLAGAARISRDDRPMDRRALTRAATMMTGVLIIGVAFVWSYVGALHKPEFHDVQLAVVAPPRLAEQIDVRSEFAATSVASRHAAVRRIDNRQAFGAIIATGGRIDVLVASAAGRAVARGIRSGLPPALQAATGSRTPIRVTDVRPLPDNDPNGITPFYLTLGVVVASFMGASSFAFAFGLTPIGRGVWWRMLGVGVLALALGVGEVGVVNAIGPLRGHYVLLVLVCLLLGTTVGALTVGLQSLLGIVGTGIAILLFVVLGNPASGGPYATTLLPGIWRTIGPYLPTGAGADLVRNTAYFQGHAAGRPLLVLFVWLAAALGFATLSTRSRRLDPQTRSHGSRLDATRNARVGV